MRASMITLCLCLLCIGELTAQDSTCTKANTPLQLRQCLSADLQQADSGLAALLSRIGTQLGDSAAQALDEATRSWKVYRREECAALLRSFEGGLEGPVAQLSCLVGLTNDRLAHLKQVYSGWVR